MIDALYLAAAVLLVLLNAFFVATEFAIVRVRNTRLDEMVESGVARAGAAREVTGSCQDGCRRRNPARRR